MAFLIQIWFQGAGHFDDFYSTLHARRVCRNAGLFAGNRLLYWSLKNITVYFFVNIITMTRLYFRLLTPKRTEDVS